MVVGRRDAGDGTAAPEALDQPYASASALLDLRLAETSKGVNVLLAERASLEAALSQRSEALASIDSQGLSATLRPVRIRVPPSPGRDFYLPPPESPSSLAHAGNGRASQNKSDLRLDRTTEAWRWGNAPPLHHYSSAMSAVDKHGLSLRGLAQEKQNSPFARTWPLPDTTDDVSPTGTRSVGPKEIAGHFDDPQQARRARIRMLEALVDDAEGGKPTTRRGEPPRSARVTATRARRERAARGEPPIVAGVPLSAGVPEEPESHTGQGSVFAGGSPLVASADTRRSKGETPGGRAEVTNADVSVRMRGVDAALSRRAQALGDLGVGLGEKGFGSSVRAALVDEERQKLQNEVFGHAPHDAASRLVELDLAAADIMPGEGLERLVRAARQLELRAYELRPGDALRAITRLADAAAQVQRSGHSVERRQCADAQLRHIDNERALDMVREAAHRVAGTLATSALHMPAQGAADALMALAETKLARQEYLDSLLARVLVLLRTEPKTLTPPVLTRIISAIGRMHEDGGWAGCSLSAHTGSSAQQRASNARFVQALNVRFVQALPDFLEDDLGWLHHAYAAACFGEEEMRRVLDRAAHLQVGLRADSAQHLERMRRLGQAARAKLPGVFTLMPAFVRDYCAALADGVGHSEI